MRHPPRFRQINFWSCAAFFYAALDNSNDSRRCGISTAPRIALIVPRPVADGGRHRRHYYRDKVRLWSGSSRPVRGEIHTTDRHKRKIIRRRMVRLFFCVCRVWLFSTGLVYGIPQSGVYQPFSEFVDIGLQLRSSIHEPRPQTYRNPDGQRSPARTTANGNVGNNASN